MVTFVWLTYQVLDHDHEHQNISQYLAQTHASFVATTGKLIQPDFTLFQSKSVLKFVDVSPYTTSKLFFLSETSSEIYVLCSDCLLFTISSHFTYINNKKVYPVSIDIPIIKFMSNQFKIVLNKSSAIKIKETCLYKSTFKYKSVRYIPLPSHCLQEAFSNQLNCSINKPCHHLVISYSKISTSRMHMQFAYVVSHHVKVVGTRYTLFYEKPQGKWENISLFSLLSPFEWYGWVLLLGFVILLCCTLKLVGFDTFPYFWLFSTLLEGGDDAKCFLNKYNFILVSIWLFPFTLLMRNAYTSSLYSLITKDPGPSNVPQSFDEIINNDKIKYLADNDHHYNIITKVGGWAKVSKV